MSQIYESRHVSWECFWNSSIEYATASFFAPSGYQEMLVAVRFNSFGSLHITYDNMCHICNVWAMKKPQSFDQKFLKNYIYLSREHNVIKSETAASLLRKYYQMISMHAGN